MIQITDLTKTFDKVTALSHITMKIPDENVFGLIGTNGAGKSTLLKLLSGILTPTSGTFSIDNKPVFENPEIKQEFFYIPDEPWFFKNATPFEIGTYYTTVYKRFDTGIFDRLLNGFELDRNRKVNSFSKGMKKQLALSAGIAARTKYLFCDETFDGLDPVVRQTVKSIFAEEIDSRGLTPIIASHNLRELEDICEHVGLLHRGGVVFERDLEEMKLGIHKVQIVLPEENEAENIDSLAPIKKEKRGRLYTLTLRGEEEEIRARIEPLLPVFYEIIPLTLEEIFIEETEVRGYDVKKLILGE